MQASDESLYVNRKKNKGKGVKNVTNVHEDTKIWVACYTAYQDSEWI